MMPRLDRYAMCAELRRLSQRPHPVLMLTAKGTGGDRVKASTLERMIPGQTVQHGGTPGAFRGPCSADSDATAIARCFAIGRCYY